MASTMQQDQARRLETIAGLAEGFRARAAQHDREASFPAENFAELREAGLLTLTMPEQDGGHGLWWGDRYRDYYRLLEELARIDCSTAQLLQVHCHATGFISRQATDEQHHGLLREIAARAGWWRRWAARRIRAAPGAAITARS